MKTTLLLLLGLLLALAVQGCVQTPIESNSPLGSHERSAAAPISPPGRATYIFACDTWTPEVPMANAALYDVFFGVTDPLDPGEEPSEEDRKAIDAAGGTILYEFNVPMIRARLKTSVVQQLEANFVRSVANPRAYMVDALIGMPVPLLDEDRLFLEALGAEILHEIGTLGISAIVPDEAVPLIRAHAGVRYVEQNGFVCGD
jgi:hypothetical protein